MKILSLIILCFFGWFATIPFDKVDATVQHFNAGRRESGKSVQYQIKLVAHKPSSKITFTNMYVGSEPVEFKVYKLTENNQISMTYQKGDTVYIDASMRYRPNNNDVLELVNNGLPKTVVEYEGKAILKYTFKNKKYELVIENFKRMPTVNYP